MRILSMVIIIFLLIIGVSFAALNSDPITINFYVGSFQVPLALALVVVLAFGVFFGLIINFFKIIKLKRACRQLKKE